jgi:hypothetical protein
MKPILDFTKPIHPISKPNVIELRIPMLDVFIRVPFSDDNLCVVRKVLVGLVDDGCCSKHKEENNNIDVVDDLAFDKIIKSVVSFIKDNIKTKKSNSFTRRTLDKFFPDVDTVVMDKVLFVLINEDVIMQWNQKGYECFRVKKHFFDLYGGEK